MTRRARSDRGNGKGLRFIVQVFGSQTDECIEWPFYRMKNGYGQLATHEGMMLAHRYVCIKVHGNSDDGMQAAHTCGNRACVNPRHVRWATQSENEADKLRHGTWFTRMGGARLNADKVRKIRAMAASGDKRRQISEQLNVPIDTVNKVVRRATWRHIP